MLVGPNSHVLCESIEIVEHLDTLHAENKLLQFDTREIALRYEQLKDLH